LPEEQAKTAIDEEYGGEQHTHDADDHPLAADQRVLRAQGIMRGTGNRAGPPGCTVGRLRHGARPFALSLWFAP
jgi:hypothetical protein